MFLKCTLLLFSPCPTLMLSFITFFYSQMLYKTAWLSTKQTTIWDISYKRPNIQFTTSSVTCLNLIESESTIQETFKALNRLADFLEKLSCKVGTLWRPENQFRLKYLTLRRRHFANIFRQLRFSGKKWRHLLFLFFGLILFPKPFSVEQPDSSKK